MIHPCGQTLQAFREPHMKLKTALSFVLPVAILLASGCATYSSSYSSDIVYRDGSYYSPADEEYGDYYYEPEPDYGSYDSYDYGLGAGYYGNRCRFSYYDRYCNTGWGSAALNFGGLSIFFGNSHYYGYGYGYGYPYYSYYGGYPYYYSPNPRPHHSGPRPMPKPSRPNNPIPDYSYSNAPGMRVPGEPMRAPTKPGMLEQDSAPVIEADDRSNLNPYTRTQPRQRYREQDSRRPEMRTKPALVREEPMYSEEMPVRQNRRPQPYPRGTVVEREQRAPVILSSDNIAPNGAVRDNRQQRQAPRVQQGERAERVERVERIERAERSERVRSERPASRDDSDGNR